MVGNWDQKHFAFSIYWHPVLFFIHTHTHTHTFIIVYSFSSVFDLVADLVNKIKTIYCFEGEVRTFLPYNVVFI